MHSQGMMPGEMGTSVIINVPAHAIALPSRAPGQGKRLHSASARPPTTSKTIMDVYSGHAAVTENRVISAARKACARCSRQVGRHVVYRVGCIRFAATADTISPPSPELIRIISLHDGSQRD